MSCITGTTSNTSTEHMLAQRRYREKNKQALRAKARTEMQAYRARIQNSEELKALARESRREADASYQERYADFYEPRSSLKL
ncbi:hypothetical protein C8F04DRAFT_1263442 [Mycena alexandri]|uniref:Uncharacterized protein n=1 Tax=Mycena alexandri TaxID=1745969 RepID=A0AAD6SNE1_9AGAR|nr:hypothetical protein C8F04DRAFT_1263442 [Mycena alexandri]